MVERCCSKIRLTWYGSIPGRARAGAQSATSPQKNAQRRVDGRFRVEERYPTTSRELYRRAYGLKTPTFLGTTLVLAWLAMSRVAPAQPPAENHLLPASPPSSLDRASEPAEPPPSDSREEPRSPAEPSNPSAPVPSDPPEVPAPEEDAPDAPVSPPTDEPPPTEQKATGDLPPQTPPPSQDFPPESDSLADEAQTSSEPGGICVADATEWTMTCEAPPETTTESPSATDETQPLSGTTEPMTLMVPFFDEEPVGPILDPEDELTEPSFGMDGSFFADGTDHDSPQTPAFEAPPIMRRPGDSALADAAPEKSPSVRPPPRRRRYAPQTRVRRRKPVDPDCQGLWSLPRLPNLPFSVGEELGYELSVAGAFIGRFETKVGRPRRVDGPRSLAPVRPRSHQRLCQSVSSLRGPLHGDVEARATVARRSTRRSYVRHRRTLGAGQVRARSQGCESGFHPPRPTAPPAIHE